MLRVFARPYRPSMCHTGPEALSRQAYNDAFMSDQRRFPSTQHLVRAAQIIEAGGV
ncbi:hypothetical protein ACTHQZ_20425 [Methylorubrum thiocyanatum]